MNQIDHASSGSMASLILDICRNSCMSPPSSGIPPFGMALANLNSRDGSIGWLSQSGRFLSAVTLISVNSMGKESPMLRTNLAVPLAICAMLIRPAAGQTPYQLPPSAYANGPPVYYLVHSSPPPQVGVAASMPPQISQPVYQVPPQYAVPPSTWHAVQPAQPSAWQDTGGWPSQLQYGHLQSNVSAVPVSYANAGWQAYDRTVAFNDYRQLPLQAADWRTPQYVGPTVVTPIHAAHSYTAMPNVTPVQYQYVAAMPQVAMQPIAWPQANAPVMQPIAWPQTNAPVMQRGADGAYIDRNLFGAPKIYQRGEPLRNALRFLLP